MFTDPPFHPRCRSTTAPYYEDDFGKIGERAGYHIPENMSYEDWKKAFIDGDKSVLEKYGLSLTDGKNSGIIKTITNAAGNPVNIVSQSDVKTTGEPNTITQTINEKGVISRNYYGENGKQTKQITNHNHGNSKNHPYGKNGEHAHDYIYNSEGKLIERPKRELTDDERKENSDIL